MLTPVKISAGKTSLHAELFDSPCARQIIAILPIETRPNEWGDEFYFEIPVKVALEDRATTKVKIGDIGYWPPGKALAIFFGPTPMSTGNDPVPASAMTPGTMMNTEDAGVTADSTIMSVPSALRARSSPLALVAALSAGAAVASFVDIVLPFF